MKSLKVKLWNLNNPRQMGRAYEPKITPVITPISVTIKILCFLKQCERGSGTIFIITNSNEMFVKNIIKFLLTNFICVWPNQNFWENVKFVVARTQVSSFIKFNDDSIHTRILSLRDPNLNWFVLSIVLCTWNLTWIYSDVLKWPPLPERRKRQPPERCY